MVGVHKIPDTEFKRETQNASKSPARIFLEELLKNRLVLLGREENEYVQWMVYNAYVAWAERNKEKVYSNRIFWSMLRDHVTLRSTTLNGERVKMCSFNDLPKANDPPAAP